MKKDIPLGFTAWAMKKEIYDLLSDVSKNLSNYKGRVISDEVKSLITHDVESRLKEALGNLVDEKIRVDIKHDKDDYNTLIVSLFNKETGERIKDIEGFEDVVAPKYFKDNGVTINLEADEGEW